MNKHVNANDKFSICLHSLSCTHFDLNSLIRRRAFIPKTLRGRCNRGNQDSKVSKETKEQGETQEHYQAQNCCTNNLFARSFAHRSHIPNKERGKGVRALIEIILFPSQTQSFYVFCTTTIRHAMLRCRKVGKHQGSFAKAYLACYYCYYCQHMCRVYRAWRCLGIDDRGKSRHHQQE